MEITKEQMAWVDEKILGKDIIFMSIHGSHLYGLAHKDSDVDIKAIYCPSKENLVMGRALKTFNYKNEELDIEIEIKSISSFLNSALSCDTNCIDLLFTPFEYMISSSKLWDELRQHRYNIFSKEMKGIIGYIKVHSYKYSNKINRYNEMVELRALIGDIKDNVKNARTCDVANDVRLLNYKFKYIKNVTLVSDHEQKYLEVCGKKYIYNLDIGSLYNAIEHEINRYGKRTKKGSGDGLDTKSLSHALRVLSQLEEIIKYGSLNFPLSEAPYIFDVKTGKVPADEVMTDIDERFDRCIELLAGSGFREVSDVSEMVKIIHNYMFSNKGG